MYWLILSIISSFLIVVTFKVIKHNNIKLFPVIVLNYFSASGLGFALNDLQFSAQMLTEGSWLIPSFIIGILLIIMFWVIGFSTQKAGIAVTTVSNKMSVIIPILFSIIYYNESLSELKIAGITAAVIAVFLSVFKKKTQDFSPEQIYLPVILFMGIGCIDVLIKYSQHDLLQAQEIPLFTAFSFGIAGVVGVITAFFNRNQIEDFIIPRTLSTGLLLGVVNFGSIYFLILALEYSGVDSSIVYAVNNMGIIALSVIAAPVFFKETVTAINWIGILLAFLSILILMQV
ncbi:MAG: EamA family transporter [Bacteroidota bacterium]|nr:EamA family transporter [Bacteroidota bacterium]